MILVGTSGFSYNDWKGPFYPEKMAQGDFLSHYSKVFNTCELNFSYYRLPEKSIFERMLDKSRGDISFSVKAFQEITHKPQCPADVILKFRESLSPLVEAERLSAILFQFPYSFKELAPGKKYIHSLAEYFEGFPIVVEFRNRAWAEEETYSFLRNEKIGFVCVDEPALRGLMPQVAVSTSPLSYVRFHGRNSAKWWDHDDPAERYDYLYPDVELAPWVPKIKELDGRSAKTLVYMNNHFRGNAVKNALRLKEMLELS